MCAPGRIGRPLILDTHSVYHLVFKYLLTPTSKGILTIGVKSNAI